MAVELTTEGVTTGGVAIIPGFEPSERERKFRDWIYTDILGIPKEFKTWINDWNALAGTEIPIGQVIGLRQAQLVSDTRLTTAGTTIDPGAIGQTFGHLKIEISGRTDAAAVSQEIGMRFNADTGNTYDWQEVVASASVVTAAESISSNLFRAGLLPGATAPADSQGICSITVCDYTGTTFQKSHVALNYIRHASTGSGMQVRYMGGSWRSTAAITSVSFFPTVGGVNFLAGTRVSIYGVGNA